MDYNLIKRTHLIVVILFLLIYLIKTILLLTNKKEGLAKFTKMVKVPEMIISTLFLATGIFMAVKLGLSKLLIVKIVLVLASIPTAIIAYKKGNKILAVLSLFMIIMAYGLAEMNKKKIVKQEIDPVVSNVNAPDYNIINHGHAVYAAYCQNCHGVDGTNGAGGANLTVSQKNMEQMKEQVLKGSSSMAPYKDFLSEQELSAVVTYVLTLKK